MHRAVATVLSLLMAILSARATADPIHRGGADSDEDPPPPRPMSDARVLIALGRKLPEVKFNDIGVQVVIDFLQDVSGQYIAVDWEALEAMGISRNALISMRHRDIPLKEALQETLDQAAGAKAKLTFIVDSGIRVGTPQELAKHRPASRPATTQSLNEQAQAEALLARKLPEMKAEPVPLHVAIEVLRDVSGASIWTNWRDIERAGISRDATTTIIPRGPLTFAEFLQQALDSAAGAPGKLGFMVDYEEGLIVVDTAANIRIRSVPKADRPMKQ